MVLQHRSVSNVGHKCNILVLEQAVGPGVLQTFSTFAVKQLIFLIKKNSALLFVTYYFMCNSLNLVRYSYFTQVTPLLK